MSRWFRFHADAMRNPKVARLNDGQFRLWVELMSVAAENDGAIPALDDLKHILKRRLDHLSRGLDDLISAGLMDVLADGYEPHNWSKFQYKSDVSTPRVHKHRAQRNVSETPTEADTETDTEEVVAKATPSPRKRGQALHPMPANWQPILTAKAEQTVDGWPPGLFDQQLAAFIDHAADKGRLSKDWQAAFRTWISRTNERTPRHGNQNLQRSNSNGVGQRDTRDGIAKALDRRLAELGPTAGQAGRCDDGPTASLRLVTDARALSG